MPALRHRPHVINNLGMRAATLWNLFCIEGHRFLGICIFFCFFKEMCINFFIFSSYLLHLLPIHLGRRWLYLFVTKTIIFGWKCRFFNSFHLYCKIKKIKNWYYFFSFSLYINIYFTFIRLSNSSRKILFTSNYTSIYFVFSIYYRIYFFLLFVCLPCA